MPRNSTKRAARLLLEVVTCVSVAALAPIAGAAAQNAPLMVKPVPTRPIADGFTLAAVGDLIYLRPMLATIAARSPTC